MAIIKAIEETKSPMASLVAEMVLTEAQGDPPPLDTPMVKQYWTTVSQKKHILTKYEFEIAIENGK